MSVTEIKLTLDDTYMNVIRFDSGSETVIIISGVSLTGLGVRGKQ